MSRVVLIPNLHDLIRRYLAGESLQALAKAQGVIYATLRNRFLQAGVCLRNIAEAGRLRAVQFQPGDHDLVNLDDWAIVARYRAGESEQAIAKSLGVTRPPIRLRLLRNGIKPRGRGKAGRVRASRMTPEERRRQALAANASVRGSRKSLEFRCKVARGRERGQRNVSPTDRDCAGMLAALGYTSTLSKAVGPYNVDVALDAAPVAVEIFGGCWHSGGSHAVRHRKRFDYLIDAGWFPIIIWVTGQYPLQASAIDKVVALAELVRSGKAKRRKEQVIWGNGHPCAVGKRKLDYGA